MLVVTGKHTQAEYTQAQTIKNKGDAAVDYKRK